MISSPAIAEVLGVAVNDPAQQRVLNPGQVQVVNYFVAQSGGITCTWFSAGYEQGVDLVALPTGAATFDTSPGCEDLTVETDSCGVYAERNGVVLSGRVFGFNLDTATLARHARQLENLFQPGSADAAPIPIPAPDAWPVPVDCESALGGIDLEAVIGDGGLQVYEGGGNDYYYPPAEYALKGNSTATCGIQGDSSQAGFTALGGARWMESAVLARPGVTEITVPGVEHTYSSVDSYGGLTYDVFDGVNWLQYWSSGGDFDVPLLAAIVAGLDS